MKCWVELVFENAFVLILCCDFFHPHIFSYTNYLMDINYYVFQVPALNMLAINASCVGNNGVVCCRCVFTLTDLHVYQVHVSLFTLTDLDFGFDVAARLISSMNHPWLLSNIVMKNTNMVCYEVLPQAINVSPLMILVLTFALMLCP